MVNSSFRWRDSVSSGKEKNHGSGGVQLLGLGLIDAMSHRVPSGAFKEHSVPERTVFGLFSDLVVFDFIVNLVVEGQLINGDLAFTRIVLQSSGEESLGEEEPRDPEGRWGTLVEPVLEEGSSLVEVNNPRGKWLQRQESNGGPLEGDLVIVETGGHFIELIGHDYFTNKRLLHVDQVILHHD